ncbi:MAG: hypothetical protein HZB53_16945 [Chloroflexi bacterium]|nr:hypothetical protein [Chloroflexota bacterium]
MTQPTVTVPNVTLTLDQLVGAIRNLDRPARVWIARALIEIDADLDAQLDDLIRRLETREPADDITDSDIEAEVRSVRTAL